MSPGHVAGAAIVAYLTCGVVAGVCMYVSWVTEWPVTHDRDEVWSLSAERFVEAAVSAVAGVFWPAFIFVGRRQLASGWRYLTTDWDPWEEQGDGGYLTFNIGGLPSGISGSGQLKSAAPSGYNASEPTEIEESSDVLEGHRVWRLYEDEHGPVLASTIVNHLYHGPVAEADRSELEAGKGLFAAKPDHPFYDGEKPQYVVEGTVELFGRVVEGRKGYRSEKLRITGLTLRPGGWHEPVSEVPSLLGMTNRGTPERVSRAFCSCQRAERPWPYPYTEIVEALEARYRCDVTYEPREDGQVFDGRCDGAPAVFAAAITKSVHQQHASFLERPETDRVLKPSDTSLIEEPNPQDIRRYGGTHGHR